MSHPSAQRAAPAFQRGDLESAKFNHKRADYYRALETFQALDYSQTDLIHHFPCFVGEMTLARYFSLFEIYKQTLPVAGHIAEVGVYKGAGTLFFAKLVELYEPRALTQVHGFDWFQGAAPGPDEPHIAAGAYAEPKARVETLIRVQKLDHVVRLHDFDLRSGAADFFAAHPHLQFKLVFLDAGAMDVMRAAMPLFWERLTPGGVLVLDQYNFDVAPAETVVLRELLPDAKVRAFPNGWMPNAYVVKE